MCWKKRLKTLHKGFCSKIILHFNVLVNVTKYKFSNHWNFTDSGLNIFGTLRLDKVKILELFFVTFVYFFPPGERSSYLTSIPIQALCFFQQIVRVRRVILSQFVQTWFTMSTWRVLSRRRRRPGHTCRSRGMAVWSWPLPTLDYTATLVKPTTGILTTRERFLNPIWQS